MTQEELDALMNEDLDNIEETPPSKKDEECCKEVVVDPNNYKVDGDQKWPPPPPTDDHKMVHQLDEVTQDSEKKAGEVFDILDEISVCSEDIENTNREIKDNMGEIKEVFEKLNKKFPQINTFSESLEKIEDILSKVDFLEEKSLDISDKVMMIMDVMQYQDIHRQKIERVINVMRALSKYMNSLFEGKIDDEKRVGSAVHIEGDNTADVVGNDDIEALIASFGKK